MMVCLARALRFPRLMTVAAPRPGGGPAFSWGTGMSPAQKYCICSHSIYTMLHYITYLTFKYFVYCVILYCMPHTSCAFGCHASFDIHTHVCNPFIVQTNSERNKFTSNLNLNLNPSCAFFASWHIGRYALILC